jgi:hypothetical protein
MKRKVEFERNLKQFCCSLNPDVSRTDDEDQIITLCQSALKVLVDFLPETKLTQILPDLLKQERADSLSK